MMKRLLAIVLFVSIALSVSAAHAEAIDFSKMTTMEWCNYEWFHDVSEIYADCVCYDYDYLRTTLLPIHQEVFDAVVNGVGGLSEEAQRELLQKWEDARVNTPKIAEPEDLRIYLWPEGGVPTSTAYPTVEPEHPYGDAADFVPYMYEVLVDDGVTPKGAVMLCSGGGFSCRCNVEEAYASALALRDRGYQCFIVNYRITPYSIDESALDVARAVRYVRAHAEQYGIDPNQIAAAGFSAGGSAITATINSYCGDVNASAIVDGYVPDELDQVSADINCYLSIYGNYNVDSMNLASYPPVFFAIGGEDGWQSCSACFDAARDAGLKTEMHIFADAPHGFGAGMDAIGVSYENAATWPTLADVFMQDAYAASTAEQ